MWLLPEPSPPENVHSHFGGQPILWETSCLMNQIDLELNPGFIILVFGKLLSYSEPKIPVNCL